MEIRYVHSQCELLFSEATVSQFDWSNNNGANFTSAYGVLT